MKCTPTNQVQRIALFFLLVLFSTCIAQSKECELKITADVSELNLDGKIYLTVNNTGNKKAKILRNYHAYKMQILNAFVYDEKSNEFVPLNFNYADIDFFRQEKTQLLRPRKSKTYTVNIFETYQGETLLKNHQYKFDLAFNFDDLYECKLDGFTELKNIEYKPN
ncbi:hypothetical protein [Chryseobacterium sp.]|uniref:hypothetical protein n=1 Tax=Chryseobacterium sp. TaxID=1871047 RepID=UPI0011C97499|nr:hypothetical protein [Chryseobacterium sp.]TXF79590.1 hypothetical protein FUA25_04190 [Chryseobacterium sp.]